MMLKLCESLQNVSICNSLLHPLRDRLPLYLCTHTCIRVFHNLVIIVCIRMYINVVDMQTAVYYVRMYICMYMRVRQNTFLHCILKGVCTSTQM